MNFGKRFSTFLLKFHGSTPVIGEIIDACERLYSSNGFEPPWIGYLAMENETLVGTCGFKNPPVNKNVEITYFSIPGNEGRGIAIAMARELIRDARPA